jgi:signal transduction histidine kinase
MTDKFRGGSGTEVVHLEAPHVGAPQETLDRLRLEVEDLRESRKRILSEADASRRQIERDLHNGVQQHLVALAMKLQLAREAVEADPSAATVLLDEIANDVREAIDEAAGLAQRIHPPRLDSGSLQAALRSWALTAGVRTAIEIRMSTDFPPEVAETVYFCCLEALEHVSPGSHVTITVRDDGDMVAFEVVDDGARSPSPEASGSGLTALHDRVETLGGHLAVKATPREGTRVFGSIPRSLRC